MKRIAVVTLAALLVTSQAPGRARSHSAAPPDPCTEPNDRAAFDVISLKSELTVTALNCHQNDRYNVFMRTYQPEVASADRTLTGYFKRVYGRKYQAQHDEYITSLAAAQEDEGLKSGTAFCDTHDDMFDEVMSLHNATELADYANSQALVQPVSLTACAAKPAAPTHPTRRRAAHHRTA
jgi:hypothetical protein